MQFSENREGFVVLGEAIPEVMLDIRYYSTFNFVGERIEGYDQPLALLTREAAEALVGVSQEALRQGYRLKIFDAYRPQRAVDHFMRWAEQEEDNQMKEYFYPDLAKKEIIPGGYLARHSGHSRGSTVDLTLWDMRTQQDLDMGGCFDFFGPRSHYAFEDLTPDQRAHRALLREMMVRHGFRPLAEEWWHFTLAQEPYPDTYFDFPVRDA